MLTLNADDKKNLSPDRPTPGVQL